MPMLHMQTVSKIPISSPNNEGSVVNFLEYGPARQAVIDAALGIGGRVSDCDDSL
jgi:hypothetical protein